MSKISIGARLALWYLAIFVLAQVIFGAGMWFILQHHLYSLVDTSLHEQVDDLTAFLRTLGKSPSLARLREEVDETYAIEHQGQYLGLATEDGDSIYRSAFVETHRADLVTGLTADREVHINRVLEGKPYRFLVEKLQVDGHSYLLQMGAPTGDVVETLSTFRLYLLLFAPLLLLVAAAGGFWLSRRALAPVDQIVRTAREISGPNLNRRLQQLDTGDELQRLSDTLNEMLSRIESAFLRVTQFTADASHELRTPVSLIRTEAEVALRHSHSEAEYQDSLQHILLEAERMTTLLEQLLSLARADSGREALQWQPVQLQEILQSLVASWQQIAVVRNLQFTASLEPDLCVQGDETLLVRLVNILLDNAFKYTPAPGIVHLLVEKKDENVVLQIQDSGLGIAAEDQGKIFERFYRVDPARSRSQGGVGLGLAIAQWIVAQHHGSISVESRVGQGATFRVKLPLAVVRSQVAQVS